MGFVATCVIAIYGIRQFQSARESSERQLRAYVFITSKVIKLHDGEFVCEFVLNNTGQTPAYQLADFSDVWFDDPDAPQDEADFTETDGDKVLCIGPSDSISIIVHFPDGANLDEVKVRTKSIWGAAKVEYVDTFGNRWCTEVLSHFSGDRLEGDEDRRMLIREYKAT